MIMRNVPKRLGRSRIAAKFLRAALLGVAALGIVLGAVATSTRGFAVDPPTKQKPTLPAEAEDPAAGGGAPRPGAKPKTPAAKGAASGSSTSKPVSSEPLLGAARSSLATGATELPAALRADKLELRGADGEKRFQFKNKGDDAVKFYDSQGKELCKLTVSTDKLKAKSADDKPLFELKRKEDKVTLRLPPDDREVWKFKPRGERLEVHSADDRLQFVARRDGNAVVLERANGELVCRAETKGGTTMVSDAKQKTLLTTAAVSDPVAILFFGWSDLTPAQQAACLVFYSRK